MEIGTTTTTSTGQTINTTPASESADEQFSAEFNNFLRLLTAQVQNQDPLSPLDSTQFVEQLATFSALEQQVQSNTALDTIATTLNDLHALIASDWLGQTVAVETGFLPYQGEPIAFEFDTPGGVDRAELTVRNRNGEIIFSDRLDTNATQHSWTGETASGEPVANDTLLQFSVDFFNSAGEFVGTTPPRVITTVNNVATENGKLRLGTEIKLSAGIDDVRKVDE